MRLIEFITSYIDNLVGNYLDFKNNIQEYYYNKDVINFYENGIGYYGERGGGDNGL